MNQELRRKVLTLFKELHRTRQTVFEGDTGTLAAARKKINSEFCKRKNVTSAEKVDDLVSHGHQVARVLRVSVIQAEQKDSTTFRVKIRPEVAKYSNKQYTPMPESMIGPFKKKNKHHW